MQLTIGLQHILLCITSLAGANSFASIFYFGLLIKVLCYRAEATSSSGEFQEVEGESEERRRARLNHHMRTQARMVCFFVSIVCSCFF